MLGKHYIFILEYTFLISRNLFMTKNIYLLILNLLFISCSPLKISEIEHHYLLADSNNNKFFIIEIIRELQHKNKLGDEPLLIIDGEPMYSFDENYHKKILIFKKDIKFIEPVEPSKSASLFGRAGRNGHISINTYGHNKSSNIIYKLP